MRGEDLAQADEEVAGSSNPPTQPPYSSCAAVVASSPVFADHAIGLVSVFPPAVRLGSVAAAPLSAAFVSAADSEPAPLVAAAGASALPAVSGVAPAPVVSGLAQAWALSDQSDHC